MSRKNLVGITCKSDKDQVCVLSYTRNGWILLEGQQRSTEEASSKLKMQRLGADEGISRRSSVQLAGGGGTLLTRGGPPRKN